MLEESLGLLSIPIGPVGLLLWMLFWTGVYYACIGLSKLLAPKTYENLTEVDRAHWNNYACSGVHSVVGFFVCSASH